MDSKAPKIALSELKKINIRQQKLSNLKLKVDLLVDKVSQEVSEIYEDHNYYETSVLNCIIYNILHSVLERIKK